MSSSSGLFKQIETENCNCVGVMQKKLSTGLIGNSSMLHYIHLDLETPLYPGCLLPQNLPFRLPRVFTICLGC